MTLDGADTPVPGAAGLPAPAWVLPVGGGLGYGDFDARRRRRSRSCRLVAATIADPLTRGAALVALWEAMLEGRVSPAAAVLDELLAALARRDATSCAAVACSTTSRTLVLAVHAGRTTARPWRRGSRRILRAGLGGAPARPARKAAWFATRSQRRDDA